MYFTFEGEHFVCQLCHMVFPRRNATRRHVMEIHLGQRDNAVCRHCGKVYARKMGLTRHVEAAHPHAAEAAESLKRKGRPGRPPRKKEHANE